MQTSSQGGNLDAQLYARFTNDHQGDDLTRYGLLANLLGQGGSRDSVVIQFYRGEDTPHRLHVNEDDREQTVSHRPVQSPRVARMAYELLQKLPVVLHPGGPVLPDAEKEHYLGLLQRVFD